MPSAHVVPFALAGFEQVPVEVSHVPASWHWSLAVHVTGLLPTQVPAWQLSDCVHAFPSLHVVPLGAVAFEHAPVPVSHVATWQLSLGVQVTGFVPTHAPAWQESVCVHAFPSLQDAELFVWTQPIPATHTSSVHGLESLQLEAVQSQASPMPLWSASAWF